MKRWTILFTLVIFLLPVASSASIWLTPKKQYQGLYMYEPQRNAPMKYVLEIAKGDMLQAIPGDGPKDWQHVQVRRNGRVVKGWVEKKYLMQVPTDATTEAQASLDCNCGDTTSEIQSNVRAISQHASQHVTVSTRNYTRNYTGNIPRNFGASTTPRASGSGFIWPLGIPGRVGDCTHPQSGRTHHGCDLIAPSGTPAFAMQDGIVSTNQFDSGGYGRYVRIYHPSTRLETTYAHLNSSCPTPPVGRSVRRGQRIGCAGTSGNPTTSMVHVEFRNTQNQFIEPMKYISQPSTGIIRSEASTTNRL
jgi:murein DD-endopeptidase MepM/ murein hydrolase activator NlpD